MMLSTLTMPSPIGPLRLFATGRALTAILMKDHRGAPNLVATGREDHPVLNEARRQLDAYFAGERQVFDVPLDPPGTPFQQTVWKALREIPPGVTWSYATLARHVGREGAARAVGSANARNPVSIIVPYHRVVGTDGKLTGYAGGLPAKQWLLAHEQRQAARQAVASSASSTTG